MTSQGLEEERDYFWGGGGFYINISLSSQRAKFSNCQMTIYTHHNTFLRLRSLQIISYFKHLAALPCFEEQGSNQYNRIILLLMPTRGVFVSFA